MNTVPVSAGCDRHIADGKNLFNSSKVAEQPPLRAQTTLAPTFMLLSKDAVKQAVKTGNQRRISRCIVDRTGNHQAIRRPQREVPAHLRYHQTHIFNFAALVTGSTAPDIFISNLYGCYLYPTISKYILHFRMAMDVLPFTRGLPFRINTLLIWFPPFTLRYIYSNKLLFKQSVSVYIGFRCLQLSA